MKPPPTGTPSSCSLPSRPQLGSVRLRQLALAAALAGASASAPAVTTLWIRSGLAGPGAWDAAANWSPGLPTPADTALIATTNVFVQGPNLATALHLGIGSGVVTIGDFDPGTLQVGGTVSIQGGRLSLNYGSLSCHTLELSTLGSYTDTKAGQLTLTGATPTIHLAPVTLTLNSQVAGTSGLNLIGPGTLVLAGTNTYSGATTVGPGSTLQVGNGGATGNLGPGTVTLQGQLSFNRSETLVAANDLRGTGSVTKSGSGTLVLTGNNTYAGGTTIASGTLQVGDGGTTGSLGTGAVSNHGTLVFNRNDAIVFDQVISGPGNLVHASSSLLVLAANQTYTGTTTITAGSLLVGNGGTTGSLGTGAVSNQGSLIFNRSDDLVVANVISGSGNLIQNSAATLVLTANHSYTGGTLIAAGTLQVGSGGGSGTLGTGPVNNLAALVINRDEALVLANAIGGTGSLRQSGAGLLALTGANTYAGTTTIDAFTSLQVGNGGTAGTLGSGDVHNDGTLSFARSDTLLVANALHGTGALRQTSNGTLILSGDNTYSGPTTIATGTLQVGNGGATGTLGSGPVVNQSRLVFQRSQDLEVSNVISGPGNVVQNGPGALIFTADQTYTGSTAIAAGSTLQVGNGGTTGALGPGDVTNLGTLVFNRSDAVTFSQNLAGSGSLRQAGTGTLTVTSALNLTGGVTVAAGTLRVGDGGTTGALGSGPVVTHGRLVFQRSDAVTLDRAVSGTGQLRHSGTGTLTLAAAHTHTGGTFIDGGGTLRVVTPSGLGGGEVNLSRGALIVDSTLAPARFQVTIPGAYTQAAGTTLELGFRGGPSASADQLAIGGRASLSGTLRLVSTGEFRPSCLSRFLLLQANGGVTGRFATLQATFTSSPLLEPQLTYGASEVALSWRQLSFQPYAVTPNQNAVATALDALPPASSSSALALLDHLDYAFLPDVAPGLRQAFDQLAPSGFTSLLTLPLTLAEQRGDQFLQRAGELRADPRPFYRALLRDRAASATAFDDYLDNPWGLYLEFPVPSASVADDARTRGYDVTARGLTLGADRRLGEESVLGVAGHYRTAEADLHGGGRVETTSAGADVYAVLGRSGWHLDGLLGVDQHSFDTRRPSLDREARGSTDALSWTALGGGGYDWSSGPLRLGTLVAAHYTATKFDAFAEQGSLAPLHFAGQSITRWNAQAGVDLRYHVHLGSWMLVTPSLYAAWRHDFSDARPHLDARLVAGSGQSYRIEGPVFGGDGFLGRAGLTFQWRPAVQTSLSYTKQFGRSGQSSDQFVLTGRLSF